MTLSARVLLKMLAIQLMAGALWALCMTNVRSLSYSLLCDLPEGVFPDAAFRARHFTEVFIGLFLFAHVAPLVLLVWKRRDAQVLGTLVRRQLQLGGAEVAISALYLLMSTSDQVIVHHGLNCLPP